jgi:hypothetical protein
MIRYQHVQAGVAWFGLLWWPVVAQLAWAGYYTTGAVMVVSGLMMQFGSVRPESVFAYRRFVRQTIDVTIWDAAAEGSNGQLLPHGKLDNVREVLLLIPHGMLCIEGGAVLSHYLGDVLDARRHICLIDRTLYALSPPAVLMTGLVGAGSVETLSHDTVQRSLAQPDRPSLVVFPGGFVEAIGGTPGEQTLYTKTYSYWIKQCAKHKMRLRVMHVYNGSSMFPQSSKFLEFRQRMAAQYSIPVMMPVSRMCIIPKLYARTWTYSSDDVQTLETGTIETHMQEFQQLDWATQLPRIRIRSSI